ncbi:MAG: hypothetical protein HC918_05885 [Oscillatoriales cyanobacterium SM2_1_8]|nr:hypothetical protein [Oscillatoriales cyanobacterium SM2_1_8]
MGHPRSLIPVGEGRRLSAATGTELQLLPGLGHCPHDEDPVTVNAAIAQWLAKHQI